MRSFLFVLRPSILRAQKAYLSIGHITRQISKETRVESADLICQKVDGPAPHQLVKQTLEAIFRNIMSPMDPEAARTAKESLDLAFHMANVLETGLDRQTLSILLALCDLGLNPEALAAVVKELRREPSASSSNIPASPSL